MIHEPEPIPDVIHIDYSIFSSFQTCREKTRLSYVRSYRPLVVAPALSFGGAMHRGVEIWNKSKDRQLAVDAFVDETKARGSALPLTIGEDEKRSVERGIGLLEAYISKYQDEPYEVLTGPDGKKYVEIAFSVFVMEWRGIPVMYSGRIDAIKRSRATGLIFNWELKTTSQALSVFLRQVKPNHQVTGYNIAAIQLGLECAGTVWDAIFVSDRKPNSKLGSWGSYGIDYEKDFGRQETRRSQTDIEEFLLDLRQVAYEYCEHRYGAYSTKPRWARNAPTACHMFGGCQFKDVCITNANQQVIDSNFRVEVWEPWKTLTEVE